MENEYYRIVLDPETAAVRSIFDKELNRELVNRSSEFGFGQYVYVTGADQEPNRLTRYSDVLQPPTMQPHGSGHGRLISISKTPFGTVAHLESVALHTPTIETEIILFDRQKKVQFTSRVKKEKVFTKEGVYFAFPLAVDDPEFLYETQNGYVNPARDMLPGAGLEWFSVQHWVAVKNSQLLAAVLPVDAPLVTLGDVVRGVFPRTFGSRKSTIFSYAMNNYWTTNYVAGQGGEFIFRYVFVSGRNISPSSLSRMGREAMSPFEEDTIFPQDRVHPTQEPLPAAQGSFLQLDSGNLVLNALKPAEDGKGIILRFTETSGQGGLAKASLPLLQLRTAWRCDAMEQCQQPLEVSANSFSFNVKPFQIVTLRLETEGTGHAEPVHEQ
jgi:hypothetical protein